MFGQMVFTHDIEVQRVQYDSRKVEPGDAFVAIRGTAVDGHKYINEAVRRGAKVVVVEDDAKLPDSFCMHTGVVKVVVANSREALARISANYFGHPSRQLTMVGVTGTNGKTTTAHLIKAILGRAGLIGTVAYEINGEVISASHTTPESLELNELLARMVEKHCTAAVMEVSSHALHQHRVDGIEFDVAVFTNLTQDHLDYHGTMEEYFKAKKILFDNLPQHATAVVNVDDANGLRITSATQAKRLTYGLRPDAEVRAENVMLSTTATSFDVVHAGDRTKIGSSLIGRFNVYNILAGYAVGIALGLSHDRVQTAISEFEPVPGRFERIVSPRGWTAIIDYAHTPDALENSLRAIHEIFEEQTASPSREHRGRIITVFGCGGDRDRGKRSQMGRIASELSDITVVTSDNPRFEDPEVIIDEVLRGVKPDATVERQVDRRKAIEFALCTAQQGDVVLIAGKGHETYQVVKDQRVHFNDREVVEEFIASTLDA